MHGRPNSTVDFLAGGGETGALLRAHDWSATELGPAEAWPQPLKTLVGVMLGSQQPMLIVWGPEHTTLYNDGYATMCGARHPAALGRPFDELWHDIWDQVEPILARAYAGEATHMDDIAFVMHRHGYPEETHFAFGYTPVRDDRGAVAGMFCACIETTGQVLAERRNVAERERLQQLFEQAPGFMAMLRGPEHVFEIVNPAYMQLVGHRDLIGKPVREALPEVQGQGFFELLDQVYVSGEAFRGNGLRASLQRAPGAPVEERFIDLVYQPVTDANGRVAGIFVEGSDATERVQAEEALRESEAFTRRVLESSTDCIKVLSLDGMLEFMSAGGMGVMEIEDFSRFKGAYWPGFWHGEEHGKALDAVTQAKVGGTGRFQGYTPTAKGNMRYWDVIVTPILGADGQPEKLLSISRDISEQRQAAEALRASEERLRLVVEGARDHAIFTTDPEGIITSWSAGAEAIFGWSAEEALRRPASILFTPEDRAVGAAEREMSTAAREGCANDERWHLRKDGTRVFMNGSVHPLPRDPRGREQGFIKIARDETERRQVDDALRESETRFRNMADHAPVMMWVTDPTGYCTYLNQRWYEFTGQGEAEAQGFGWLDATYPDDKAKAERAFVAANAAQEPFRAEYRLRRADGAYRWAIDAASPRFGPGGEFLGYVGSVIDIDERREMEEALRLRGEEFYALADNISSLCWIAYADGHIFWYNRRWYEYTGMAPESQEGWGWESVHDPDMLPAVVARWKHSIDTGEPFEMTFPLKGADGTFRPFLTRIVPIRDETDRIVRWFGTNVDITEQREAEVRLEQSVEERTRERDQLWDLSEDLLAVANYEGGLLRASPSWTRLFGYDQETLLTRPYGDIIHPDDLGATMDALLTMRSTGRSVRFENRVLAANGTWRWVAWTVSAEPSGERLIAVGRDITGDKAQTEALRQAEEQLRQAQKMEAVGQLTGGIAHDFNNLLAGIVGSLDLMQTRITQGRTDAIERYAKAAMSSAQRAAALTHRLLAFSRRQPLDPKSVNANQLITSMEDLLRRTIGPLHALEFVTAGGLWTTLCDPNQLESAILNLAINARDAMPEGGKLTIETCNAHLDDAYAAAQRDVTPGQYVCICITDTGTGMPPDVVARAFEPFFTTKPLGQGTGLGLSMVYGFAKQSEGHLKIYSEEGRGTTMKIYLPRHRGGAQEEHDLGDPGVDAPRAEPGETVLVVEDEPVIRDLIVEILQDLGYRALEAGDGPSGLKILQSRRRIDLLVTDVGLPGLNGRQLADYARERRPDLKVLFITGYAENATLANGFLDPGMEMITKPFAVEALASKIRGVIGGR